MACPVCGREMEGADGTCAACRARAVAAQPLELSEAARKKKSKITILVGLLMMLMGSIMLVVYAELKSSGDYEMVNEEKAGREWVRRESSSLESGGQAEFDARSKAANSAQTKWIAASLRQMQTMKPGMTRGQLAKVFTTEGGVSTRTQRRYVYRECPYIKVDVRFRPVGRSKQYPHSESRHDVITQISQPFLEWSIMD